MPPVATSSPGGGKRYKLSRAAAAVHVEDRAILRFRADGEPKVLIPFDQLRDILKPGGALAALASGAE